MKENLALGSKGAHKEPIEPAYCVPVNMAKVIPRGVVFVGLELSA